MTHRFASENRHPLVVLGAGGTAVDFCEAAGAAGMRVLGMLDDCATGHVSGFPVLGRLDYWSELPSDALFFCAIGSTSSHRARLGLIERLGISTERFARVVHPSAVISPSAVIAPGCGILALSTLGARVHLEPHVEILQSCVVAHDCQIRAGSILAGGANLTGEVQIGAEAYIGAGALVRNGIRIGDRSLLGMNSTLLNDMPRDAVFAGVPARPVPPSKRP